MSGVCLGICGTCGASGTDFKCDRAVCVSSAQSFDGAFQSRLGLTAEAALKHFVEAGGVGSTQIVSGSTASRSPRVDLSLSDSACCTAPTNHKIRIQQEQRGMPWIMKNAAQTLLQYTQKDCSNIRKKTSSRRRSSLNFIQ